MIVVAVALVACGPGPARRRGAANGSGAASRAVVAIVALPDYGTDVAVGADGRVYVPVRTGTLVIVDPATARVAAEVTLDGEPYAVAVNRDGRRAYVVDFLGQYVSVVDTRNAAVTTRIPVGTRRRPSLRPSAVASRDGTTVYVGDTARDHLVVVAGAVDEVSRDLFLDIHPAGVALPARGRFVYVAGCRLACVDGTLLEIDTTTWAVTRRLWLASVPTGLVVTPDGRRAYVTNGREGTVSAIDLATERSTTIAVGPEPIGVAIDDAGTRVYATSFAAGTLTAIATATDAVVGVLAIGAMPRAVAVSPDGRRAYVTSSSAILSIVDLGPLRR